MSILGYIILFILGACFGSFGGVLLERLENFGVRGLKDVVFGRSKCDHTGKTLRWFELIPIVSYLIQKGRSRHTNELLVKDYIWLEIICGCIFVATALLTQTNDLHTIVYQIVFNRLLFLLAWYDMKHQFLHTPVWAIALVWQALMGTHYIAQSVLGAVVFGIVFGIIWLIARWYAKAHYGQNEGFGSGDVLLALVLGASIPNIFAIYGIPFSAQTLVGALVGFLCISSILGLIYALVAYILSRKRVVFIPFLPAMILAYWILLYQGEVILRFVLGS